MSIFGSIMSAILGPHSSVEAPKVESNAQVPPGASDTAPATPDAPMSQPAVAVVDVAEVLTAKAAEAGQALDWRHSIVDLMKLLDLDSSLAARKELATELHYSGDMNDSAAMNTWLHGEVMQKLSENGGKISGDLRN